MASNIVLGVNNTTSVLDARCPALGTVVWVDGIAWKFVQFKDAVTYVCSPAMIVEYANTAGTAVTNDRAGGSSLGRTPAGVMNTNGDIPAQNDYGYIQLTGIVTVGPTDGAVALGEMVMAHATTDGGADTWTYTSSAPIGQALADDTGTASVIVRLIGLL